MKSMRIVLAASAMPLALAIAGCSHSGASGPGPGLTAGDVIAKTTGDTAANALNDGKMLKADSTTADGMVLNYTDYTATKAKGSSFTIRKNAGGGLDMTVNGETVSFAQSDGSIFDNWERNESGKYYNLYAAAPRKDEDYFQVWHFYVDAGDSATQGFAVAGAETAPSVVKSHANATYVGEALAETALASDVSNQTRTKGDLTLQADFQDGSVKGSIDNLKNATSVSGSLWTAYQDAAPGTSIEMTKAQISANGFAGGKLVAHDPGGDIGSLDSSTYSGRFYGPDADQVAGVMSIQGTGDDGKFVGSGFFAGNKQ